MLGENTALSEKPEAGPGGVPAVLCDRFVLEERLEQGRFGTMYRAHDRLRGQDGRAHVAVLILPSEVARQPEQLAAFERELEAVRMLSHPNIVRMFGLERDGDRTFLVLEWVDGESLRSVVDSLAPETVCEADALAVVRAVGNALVYAHARGVVHGDVRPENVLVTERGEVRLLFTSACLATTAPFTIAPRDDVRGLAALAYELMSGSPPPIGGLYPRGNTDEPEPIEGLNRKRWKALRSAMSMRDGRISSIRKLLAALDLPEPKAPRRGSRPDRIRDSRPGALKRVALAAVVCAGVAALVVVGPRVWNDRADDLAALSASVESGAGRAKNLTREGLAGARDRLGRAGNALAGLWSELGERVEGTGNAGNAGNEVEAGGDAAEAPADDAVPDAELFEAEELNGFGEGASDAAAADAERAEDSSAVPAADDRPVPAENDRGVAAETAGDESTGQGERAEVSDAAPTAESREEPGSREEPAERGIDSGSASATVAAAPDAAAPSGRVTFSRGDYVVSESEGVAAIEIRRDGARGDAAFVWWTRDGSARNGDDYADLGRRVEQLRDGETTGVLYVPITSDSIAEERRETFEVHLGVLSEDGSQSGALESVQVTIIDDDG